MIGIYAIFRKSDNKCMYVGQSKDVERRIIYHLKYNTNINVDKLNYYGKIIETFDFYDKENQLNREAYWINELNPELNTCRNRHFKSKKLSEIAKTRTGEKNPMYRYKWSDEQIEQIRKHNIGKKRSKQSVENNRNAQILHAKLHPRCWINNGIEEKFIQKEYIQQYLNNGWIKGRLKRN